MRKRIDDTKDQDRAEFLRFMLANLNYQVEFVRLQKDIESKIKDEETRAAFKAS